VESEGIAALVLLDLQIVINTYKDIYIKMKTISQVCFSCGASFLKERKEVNRKIRNGNLKFFCSKKCSAIESNKSPRERITPQKQWGNQFACKGKFTFYLNKAKHRHKEFDLDEEYLDSIWNGVCPLTNLPIKLKNRNHKNCPFTASLDRKDSSKGYVKGNVQFVSYSANLAKNNFSDSEIKDWIEKICQSNLSSQRL